MLSSSIRRFDINKSQGNYPYVITNKGYGKDKIMMAHVTRDGPYHTIHEFEMSVHVKLSDEKDYLNADNSNIVDSDALKNIMIVEAKKDGVEGPEQFGITMVKKILSIYAHIVEISLRIEAFPWKRVRHESPSGDSFQLHNHAFVLTPTALRYCDVIMKQGDAKPTVVSGFKKLSMLKTTQSSFTDFVDDEYRTTPQLTDRILCTVAEGAWEYVDVDKVDFTKTWESLKDIVVETFTGEPINGTNSISMQRTAYDCTKAVLDKLPQVAFFEITLPNNHYIPYDLTPFQNLVPGENNDVFFARGQANGIVYAQLSRKDLPLKN